MFEAVEKGYLFWDHLLANLREGREREGEGGKERDGGRGREGEREREGERGREGRVQIMIFEHVQGAYVASEWFKQRSSLSKYISPATSCVMLHDPLQSHWKSVYSLTYRKPLCVPLHTTLELLCTHNHYHFHIIHMPLTYIHVHVYTQITFMD